VKRINRLLIFVFFCFCAASAQDHIHWGSAGNPRDSLTITWRSITSSSDSIKWGYTSSSYGNITQVTGRKDSTNTSYYLFDYKFALTSPSSDTIHYLLYDGSWETTDRTFHIPAKSDSTSFSFIAGGDIQDPTGSIWKVSSDTLNKQSADFHLILGDIINTPATASEWVAWYDSGATFLKNHLFYPTCGNHDNINRMMNQYVMPGTEKWYSFEMGNAIFICLYSEDPSNSTQLAWLENVLKTTTKTWKIVFFHKPFFTASQHVGEMNSYKSTWWHLFDHYGVNVVLNGHTHFYLRSRPINLIADATKDTVSTYGSDSSTQGRLEMITGVYGAGASTLDAAVKDSFIAVNKELRSYSKFTINGSILTMRAYDITKDTLIDSLTLTATASFPAPTLLSPTNSATNQTIAATFKWDSVSKATKYRIQVSTDSSFSSTVKDSILSGIGDTSLALTLSNGTKYFWHVKAMNATDTSAWSTEWKFTTIVAAPAVPVLVSPANKATNRPVPDTLKWDTAGRAASYHVQVAKDTLFSTIVKDTTVSGITDTFLVVKLANDSSYFWHVKSINVADSSAWSTEWKFTDRASPSAPSPASPANGSVSQPLSVTLKWDSVSTATVYQIQVLTDTNSATLTIRNDDSTSSLTDTSKAFTFTYDSTYYWRVRAKNAGGAGAWSTIYKFTTILVTPVLKSPSSGVSGLPLTDTLKWSGVSGATLYRIQVSLDTNFLTASIVVDSAQSDSSKAITLSYGTKYFWRVLAKNDGGDTSLWSTEWKFKTLLAAPVLKTPLSEATGQAIADTLKWSGVSGATSYKVQVSTDIGFTTITDSGTQTDSSRAVSLVNNTGYFWHVRAISPDDTSAWSTEYKFYTVPATPILSSPSNGSTGLPVKDTLKWGGVSGATFYNVQISKDSNFTSESLSINDTALSSLKIVSGLSNGRKYFWRVNASNTNGSSAWSSRWKFTTIIAASGTPSLASPDSGSVNRPLIDTLKWNAVTDAASYNMQVSTLSDFSVKLLDSSGLTVTSCLVKLSNDSAYYWRVNSKNTGGISSWSSVWKFTAIVAVPGVPVPASPANDTTNMPITDTLKWSAVTGATSYHVQISTDTNFSTIIDSATVSSTNKAVSLANSTKYFWHVKAINAGGVSAWSLEWKFTTIVAAPGVPVPTSPGNDTSNLPITDTLKWSAVTGAISYYIQISTDTNFATVFDSATVTSAYKAVTLANNTKYFWRVKAINAGGNSEWSSEWKFITIIARPSAPKIVLPVDKATITTDTITFCWDMSTPSVDGYFITFYIDSTMSDSAIFLKDSTITDTFKIEHGFIKGKKYWWRVSARNAAGMGSNSVSAMFILNNTGVLPRDYSCILNGMAKSGSIIRYGLPAAAHVSIKLYNLQGRIVRTLCNTYQNAGYYRVNMNCTGLSREYYLLDFKAGNYAIKKLFPNF
jgi:hypothetical protein